MHYAYPAILEPDGAGYMIRFEGLPGVTWGETEAEALRQGQDLLATSLEMLIEDGDPIPEPTPADGRPVVETEV